MMYRLAAEVFAPILISMGRVFGFPHVTNIKRDISIGTDRCVISALIWRYGFFFSGVKRFPATQSAILRENPPPGYLNINNI